LPEALECCARWIAADKVNSFSHYLRAVILQEQGDMEEAIQSLRRAIYLDPDFVLAHFALGNIARSRGRVGEADKQIKITLQLLKITCRKTSCPSPKASPPASFLRWSARWSARGRRHERREIATNRADRSK